MVISNVKSSKPQLKLELCDFNWLHYIFNTVVYKVKLAILGLNVNNFATSKDILMKLRIQRALYYGSE